MNKKDESKSRKRLYDIMCVIVLIIVLLVFIADDMKNRSMVRNLKTALKSIKTTTTLIKKEEVVDCEEEFDNSLRKHIEIYIKRRYSKTPQIIAKEISRRIILLANRYDLPPELLVGMIEIESMFNPFLQSKKGARGLMQVMPEWVPKLNLDDVNDLHEIDIGIESGIKVFLIHLQEADGNISGGLFRYVNKDSSYVEKVYSAVGRFVTYRSIIEKAEKNIKKEKGEDDSNNGAERHSE